MEKIEDETGGIITKRSYIEAIKYESGSVIAVMAFSTQAEASLVLSNANNIIDTVMDDYTQKIRSINQDNSQGSNNEFYLK